MAELIGSAVFPQKLWCRPFWRSTTQNTVPTEASWHLCIPLAQSLVAPRYPEHSGLPRVVTDTRVHSCFCPSASPSCSARCCAAPTSLAVCSPSHSSHPSAPPTVPWPLFISLWNIWSAPWHGLLDGFERKFPWENSGLKKFLELIGKFWSSQWKQGQQEESRFHFAWSIK